MTLGVSCYREGHLFSIAKIWHSQLIFSTHSDTKHMTQVLLIKLIVLLFIYYFDVKCFSSKNIFYEIIFFSKFFFFRIWLVWKISDWKNSQRLSATFSGVPTVVHRSSGDLCRWFDDALVKVQQTSAIWEWEAQIQKNDIRF